MTETGLQGTGDLRQLFDDAQVAQNFLQTKVGPYCDAAAGATAIMPGVKSRDSAERKLHQKYLGDARRLTDLARCSIVCDSMEQVATVLEGLQAEFKIEQLDDNFATPKDSGYRDASMKLRCPNGHLAEVQVHLRSIQNAKKAEIYYFESRDILNRAKAEDRFLTEDEAALRDDLDANARRLYQGAIDRDSSTELQSVSPTDAAMDATRASDAARVAVTRWRNLPGVAALTRRVAKDAREAGMSPEELLKDMKPDGPQGGLFKDLCKLLGSDGAARRGYADLQNALEGAAWQWSRSIAIAQSKGTPADAEALRERFGEYTAELADLGRGVPAKPEYSIARQAISLSGQLESEAQRMMKHERMEAQQAFARGTSQTNDKVVRLPTRS